MSEVQGLAGHAFVNLEEGKAALECARTKHRTALVKSTRQPPNTHHWLLLYASMSHTQHGQGFWSLLERCLLTKLSYTFQTAKPAYSAVPANMVSSSQ
jgi:hypothetical protein